MGKSWDGKRASGQNKNGKYFQNKTKRKQKNK